MLCRGVRRRLWARLLASAGEGTAAISDRCLRRCEARERGQTVVVDRSVVAAGADVQKCTSRECTVNAFLVAASRRERVSGRRVAHAVHVFSIVIKGLQTHAHPLYRRIRSYHILYPASHSFSFLRSYPT